MTYLKPEIDRNSAMELWIAERSDYAKEQLVLNNVGIVRFVIQSLNLNPLDEDLFATGLVGIVKAVNMFNADSGFAFSTYATRIVRNEILMTFRKKRIAPLFSLDEPCCLESGDQVNYADIVADDKHFEEVVITDIQFAKAFSALNEREQQIMLLKINGKTQDEIAEILKVSQAQVSRIIRRIFKKFRLEFS